MNQRNFFSELKRRNVIRAAGLYLVAASMRVDTLLPNLRHDARWEAFLRTMGLTDDQLK